MFRYAFVSQNLGYIAIPIFYYHLSRSEKRRSTIALVLACSSLVQGFAFYSRSQIFSFALVFVFYYFLVQNTLPRASKIISSKVIKRSLIIIIPLFFISTVVRFSAMDYYANRIPEKSIIQNPILFSLVDYAGQGYSNGLMQLERYSEDKGLEGEQFFRDTYQILNFIGIMDWDAENSKENVEYAYDYDGGAFKGYTAHLVFNFGYILSFIISFSFYILVKIRTKDKSYVSVESQFITVFLLLIPIVSIFYAGYQLIFFPLIFIAFVRAIFLLKNEKYI